jgi:hypothetical protein
MCIEMRYSCITYIDMIVLLLMWKMGDGDHDDVDF